MALLLNSGCGVAAAENKSRLTLQESRPRRLPSDRHLRAHFHHPPGGDLEIVGRVVGDAREHDEQAILPARHAGMDGRLERAPRQEERGRHDVELPAVLTRDCERSGTFGVSMNPKRRTTRENVLPTGSMRTRSAGSARGRSAVSIVKMTLCSCSTL